MTIKIGAEGHIITNAPDLRGIKMRIADRKAIEDSRDRALESMDPFSHGGYQPEPVTDPIVEVGPLGREHDLLEKARRLAREKHNAGELRQILGIKVRRVVEP